MVSPLPITVIVHTKNSAETLERCLASLPPTNELLVVDMASQDKSLLIARRFHARTISVADVGYVEPARSIAIEAASQPWILILDADEELPTSAAEWLPDLIADNSDQVYAVPRKNIVFGMPLKHAGWWPDRQIRLFRKGTVNWPTTIHAQPQCTVTPHELPATDTYAIIHHNYQSIGQFVGRANRYTTIEARHKDTASTLPDAWLKGWSDELFSRYFALEGWRDGAHGLAVSLLQAHYVLITALKQWEKDNFPQHHQPQLIMQQIQSFRRDAAYWVADYYAQQTKPPLRWWWQIRRKLKV